MIMIKKRDRNLINIMQRIWLPLALMIVTVS